MNIEVRKRGRNHSYVDTLTGEKVVSVTTFVGGGLPKPQLINWAGKATAEYALDHWDELSAMTPSERLNAMKKGRYQQRDFAAVRGTDVHKLAQRLILGETVTVPDHLRGFVTAALRVIDEFDLQPEYTEAVVYSDTYRHAGRLDLIGRARIPDMPDYEHIPVDEEGYARGLFDWKTSASGIFGEVAMQLAPYRFSEWLLLDDGTPIPMPEVDFCAGIHLRSDGGYQLVPLEVGREQYDDSLYLKEVHRIVEGLRDLVGDPIVPPVASSYQLNRVEPAPLELLRRLTELEDPDEPDTDQDEQPAPDAPDDKDEWTL